MAEVVEHLPSKYKFKPQHHQKKKKKKNEFSEIIRKLSCHPGLEQQEQLPFIGRGP
jgi:hypothetical protein